MDNIPWSFTGPPPGQYPHHNYNPHIPPVSNAPFVGLYGQVPTHGGHPWGVPGPRPPSLAPATHSMPGSTGIAHANMNLHVPFPMLPMLPPHSTLRAAHGTQPHEQKYASKRERERAKKERKEARKLAENPLVLCTEDAKPRPYLNEDERRETEKWIAERKANYPTRERIEKRTVANAALSSAGASFGPRMHDEALFQILREQQKLGLLKSAGTEDLFKALTVRNSGKRARGHKSKGQSSKCQRRGHDKHSMPTAHVESDGDCPPGSEAPPLQGEGCYDGITGDEIPFVTSTAVNHVGKHDVEVDLQAPSDIYKPAETQDFVQVDNVVVDDGQQASQEMNLPCNAASARLGIEQEQDRQTRRMPDSRLKLGHSWSEEKSYGHSRDAAHKPCLLHRMVAADVRQDRNMILQTFRFLVRNEFLQ